MEILKAHYIGSYPAVHKCPQDDRFEYAFIGRSNVGKSSLINMITNHKKLAKVSSTPGKTQYLNYFLINNNWYLVDLPGYGYAKISKTKRKEWEKMIRGYLSRRSTLVNTFVLIDANIPPQKIDIDFINDLGSMAIPFSIVYTKVDKSKDNKVQANIEAFRKALLEYWNEMPPEFESSANKKTGKEDILQYIEQTNEKMKHG